MHCPLKTSSSWCNSEDNGLAMPAAPRGRNFTYHIENADKEHKLYIQCRNEAREEHQSLQHPEPDCRPCYSDFIKAHYTFDFAQCGSISHHSRQVGPLFFETPGKIQIFGICMEGSRSQYNYLIDEDQTIGKDGENAHGPNTVISILHHHFKNHGMREKCVVLHCDNCPGICNLISYSCFMTVLYVNLLS